MRVETLWEFHISCYKLLSPSNLLSIGTVLTIGSMLAGRVGQWEWVVIGGEPHGDCSLVTSPHAPPSEKRSGEQSRIFWAYYPKW